MNWPDDFIDQIICSNNLDILKTLPNESINCCITSPPYWALRDYGVDGQLGLEPTFHEYLDRLIAIFDEVKRVLRKDGTCWVVLGDTYNSQHQAGTTDGKTGWKHGKLAKDYQGRGGVDFLPIKSLLQIPSRFAILMVDHGWILRNEIIWYKPNCMPASVKDRFTVDFEKVFFFVKNKKYWFEQQFENIDKNSGWAKQRREGIDNITPYQTVGCGKWAKPKLQDNPQGRNKRCVWQIPTKPFKEAHFAVFPPTLVVPMIKAGCPENGIVLDPFMGSGTVAKVALKLNRHFIGIELSPEYCEMAKKRIKEIQPQLVFG
jgi:DNA modification methylase